MRTPLARSRAWLMRLVLAVCAPALVVLAVEGGLRLIGFGYPTTFLVSSPDGGGLTTNRKFAVQYFGPQTVLKPFLFTIPKEKAPGTVRICVLGGSAAMGTPDPAFSFARIMRIELEHRYPGKRFEFMNAAMRGINSYIVRAIAAECARHQVDLFVIYMGNNEVEGLHAPDPDSRAMALWLPLVRAADWLRATRIGQALSRLTRRERETQTMAFFRAHAVPARDWRRQRVYENFQANLEDILESAAGAGARVLLCTVPVNLADCPPLVSLHDPGLSAADRATWEGLYRRGIESETAGKLSEAIRIYGEAGRIDDQFADLHFRLARCCLASREPEAARKEFILACDWDALQFRSDSSINQRIREAAAQPRGKVVLVDTEHAFARSSLSVAGVPGNRLFCDHVHPTFTGTYVIATNCLSSLEAVLRPLLGPSASPGLLGEQACADALGYTLYHELNITDAMVRLKSKPPFLDQLDHAARQAADEAEIRKRFKAFSPAQFEACLRTSVAALARDPEDWPLRFNLGSMCLELGRFAEAAGHFQILVKRYPQVAKFRLLLAAALLKSGNRAAATAQLSEAARGDPWNKPVREALQALTGSVRP